MTDTEKNIYDAVIIGGGPAGIMAAISVKTHHPEYRTLIIDQSAELGRKLLVSGAGRANLTNTNLKNNPEKYYYHNHFVKDIFSKFGYADMEKFFLDMGIPMYEETKNSRGKIFPIINNARTVREILVDKLIELSVEVKLGLQIQQINLSENVWKILSRDTNLTARSLILTAGGKTYPSLGSDGSGYMLTQSIGHKIIEPVPCAVPLVSKNQLSHFLQGETVKMKVISVIGGKITDESTGEVMFTQYGFSGPAIFDVSRNISLRLNRGKISDVKLRLSFLPDMTADEIKAEINQRISNHPKLPLAHAFYGLLTVKSSGAVCAVSNISKDRLAGDITGPEKDRLMNVLTDFQTDILQTRGWNEAEFTSGGIDTGEIDSHTLASKLNQSLYFAGEIIDVDGMVGGYNLSWAWASGWIAGKLG